MSLVGKELGHHRIVRLIGKGGMGEVYLADDLNVTRPVAIKVVQAEVNLRNDERVEEAARLFRREMRAITMLDHPNILTLFDVGETTLDDTILTYMVMQYRPEGSLLVWLHQNNRRYPLTQEETAHFIMQAASALQHAHDQGIIHLDVKPSNFLVRNRRDTSHLPDLLLADFGISKITNSTRGVKGNTSSHGTVEYTAPEQWNNAPVAASDQYALAIMAYEFLTGRIPFEGNMLQVIYQHIHVSPPPPSRFQPSLNPAIDAVLLHALEKKPEDRFPSIAAFARALQQAFVYCPLQATISVTPEGARTGMVRTIYLPGKRQVSVTVPPNVQESQALRVEGEGEAYYEGGPRGSLLLSVAIRESSGSTGPTPALEKDPHQAPPVHSVPPQIPATPLEATVLAAEDPLPARVFEPTILASPPALEKASFAANAALPTVPENVPALPNDFKAPPNKPRTSLARILLLSGLALALIVAGVVGFSTYQAHVRQLNAAATVQAETATSQAENAGTATAQANASATAEAMNAAATASANATATAVAAANAYPSYLPFQGTLAFADSLNGGGEWNSSTDSSFGGDCQFSSGTYHVSETKSNHEYICQSTQTFSNFAVEVQMTIINGDCGGITFRHDNANGQDYDFKVCQDGTYQLTKYVDNTGTNASTLKSGTTTVNTNNTLDVVASGSEIDLYINGSRVDGISDSSYTTGTIALEAADVSNTTEVSYANAKLWQL